MKKKLIASVCALTLLIASQAAVFAAAAPADVTGKEYEKAVTSLMDDGIITGDVDGLYHPDDTLTRAQACKIVIATVDPSAADLNGTPTQNVQSSGFKDLSGYKWAESYINYAASHGIVQGYGDGTFRPGGEVTVPELCAMLLRASGVADSEVTGEWPDNYVNKAAEMGLYKDTGMVSETGEYYKGKAAKWMAAWLTYNAQPEIKKANAKTDDPQGTDKDKVAKIPVISGEMTFTKTGKIDTDITTFNNIPLSSKVEVYVYGVRSDYAADMAFSKKLADYRQDTIFKFKNVSAPAWYKVESGKVTALVFPGDVGFSGRALGVINGLSATLNTAGEAVSSLETLTAQRHITWLAESKSTTLLTAAEIAESIANGDLMEISISSGQVRSVQNGKPGNEYVGRIDELTTGAWEKVTKRDSIGVLWTDESRAIEFKNNIAVYILSSDGKEYKAGSFDDVDVDDCIRAYDFTDDDINEADILLVKPASAN